MKTSFILTSAIILYLLLLNACHKPSVNMQTLGNTIWIFDSSRLPDSATYGDDYISFDSAGIVFNGNYIGMFSISGDTLRFTEPASTQQKEKLLFEGVVVKLTEDTLRIRKLNGKIQAIYPERELKPDKKGQITFVNQELFYDRNIDFKELSLEIPSC